MHCLDSVIRRSNANSDYWKPISFYVVYHRSEGVSNGTRCGIMTALSTAFKVSASSNRKTADHQGPTQDQSLFQAGLLALQPLASSSSHTGHLEREA